MSFFVQNFQDAQNLDESRIHNCSFHAVTDSGGVSMCLYNTERDELIIPNWMTKGLELRPRRPPIGEVDRATQVDLTPA